MVPRAGDRGMAIPVVEDVEKEGDVERCDDDDDHGCRSSGTVDRRLSVLPRGCFDPRRQRAAANGASPAHPRRELSRVAEGLGCNFIFCVDPLPLALLLLPFPAAAGQSRRGKAPRGGWRWRPSPLLAFVAYGSGQAERRRRGVRILAVLISTPFLAKK